MPTHIHILAWLEDTTNLSSIIKSLTLSYHYHYRKHHRYKGHLWHGRYRSILVSTESHWIQCGRYIEINSVHAGLCNDPSDYPWSSYHHYAFSKSDPLLRPIMYKDRPGIHHNASYEEFIKSGIDLEYQRLKIMYEKG